MCDPSCPVRTFSCGPVVPFDLIAGAYPTGHTDHDLCICSSEGHSSCLHVWLLRIKHQEHPQAGLSRDIRFLFPLDKQAPTSGISGRLF